MGLFIIFGLLSLAVLAVGFLVVGWLLRFSIESMTGRAGLNADDREILYLIESANVHGVTPSLDDLMARTAIPRERIVSSHQKLVRRGLVRVW